jgi:hypothetical protein
MTQGQLQKLWLKALLFVLFGYALAGKGFAYLFLGEMILVIGFFFLMRSQRIMVIFSDSVLCLWAMLAFWGFCRTVPFLGKYGFDAVRDAAVYAYGMFAVLVVAFINNSNQISRALNTYRKFLVWYLPIVPLCLSLLMFFQGSMPTIPWASGVGFVHLKAGDAAVHITGAALFILIFADRKNLSFDRILGFVGWVLAALIILVKNRGGFVAIILPIAFVSLMRARKVGWKVIALAIAITIPTIAVLESDFITLPTLSHQGRAFTAEQVSRNLSSISGTGSSGGDTENTKQWRLGWWKNIIDYTVFGPYRWTGKGFGVNLTLVDGPPGMSAEDTTLRSPHNGTMTMLARMGVPGLAIWAALNIVFVFRLLKAYWQASRVGSKFWSCLDLWILSYYFAILINSSFDVYIEGPHGGIWFWSIIGFGVAAMRVQAHEARKIRAQAQPQATFTEEASALPNVAY